MTTLPRPDSFEYVYRATLVRVMDGNIVEMIVDLGFQFSRRERFRLAGIGDQPLHARDLDKARIHIEACLKNAKTIAVQSIKGPERDQFFAHIFYHPEEVDADRCYLHGAYLNGELVEAGYSTPNATPTKLN